MKIWKLLLILSGLLSLVACGGNSPEIKVTYYDHPVVLDTERPTAVAAIKQGEEIVLIVGQTLTHYLISTVDNELIYVDTSDSLGQEGVWFGVNRADDTQVYFHLVLNADGIVSVVTFSEAPPESLELEAE